MIEKNEMRVGPYRIEIHFPLARGGRGRGLAPCAEWPVHDVADYADTCPQDWNIGTPTRGGFFMGGMEGRELWLDLRPMNHLPHHVAVLVIVQGVNVMSGLPAVPGMSDRHYEAPARPTLEQYKVNCPVHAIPMGAHGLCEVCGFRRAPQNYITNAAGPKSVTEFWRDGHVMSDGTIGQFAVVPTSAGTGVAQQVLGEARTLAIDLVVFRSVAHKPAPVFDRPAYRGGVILCAGGSGLKGSGSGSGRLGCSDREENGLQESHLTGDSDDGYAFDDLASSHVRRVGAPRSMEVGMGREVDQVLHPDPNPLSYWHHEPVAMFTLFPVDNAWVLETTRNGPTTKTVKSGPFAGIRTAG